MVIFIGLTPKWVAQRELLFYNLVAENKKNPLLDKATIVAKKAKIVHTPYTCQFLDITISHTQYNMKTSEVKRFI